VLSCLPPRLLKGAPRRHSTDEASLGAQTHSHEAINAESFEA